MITKLNKAFFLLAVSLCFLLCVSFSLPNKSCNSLFMPALEFKFNSTNLVDSTDGLRAKISTDSVIGIIKQIMVQNPDVLLMELSGYAGANEKNPKQLSQKRAEKIKNFLVKRGVLAQRLVGVGYGSGYPLITLEQIREEKDPKGREKLRQKNRRVTFKILEFKQKDKSKIKEVEEEDE
jgi:outer membrane protein OmpA-like peptidoglycan-associated protein